MHRRLLSAAATSTLLLGLSACSEPTDGPVTTPPPSIDIGAPSDGGGDAEPSDGDGEKTAEPTAEAPDIPPPDPRTMQGRTSTPQRVRSRRSSTTSLCRCGRTRPARMTFSSK